MNQKQILLLASAFGFIAVALGAFGAHTLQELLERNGRAGTYELAVRYQIYHMLVLLFLGTRVENIHKISSLFFCFGILLFSGSLYFLALSNSTTLVLVTPLGGVFLLAGWVRMGWEFYNLK